LIFFYEILFRRGTIFRQNLPVFEFFIDIYIEN